MRTLYGEVRYLSVYHGIAEWNTFTHFVPSREPLRLNSYRTWGDAAMSGRRGKAPGLKCQMRKTVQVRGDAATSGRRGEAPGLKCQMRKTVQVRGDAATSGRRGEAPGLKCRMGIAQMPNGKNSPWARMPNGRNSPWARMPNVRKGARPEGIEPPTCGFGIRCSTN